MERVHRKAVRFCLQNFNKTGSVTDMLSDLKWDTLETRRKKNRLTLMYKVSHNLADINTEEHLIPNEKKEHAIAMLLSIECQKYLRTSLSFLSSLDQ